MSIEATSARTQQQIQRDSSSNTRLGSTTDQCSSSSPHRVQNTVGVESQSTSQVQLSSNKSPQEQEFLQTMEQLLIGDAQGNVHEEQMQYAIVAYLLDQVSPEASKLFQDVVNQVIGSGNPPMSAEDAVKQGLQAIVDQGLISEDQAEFIHGMSFRAAQLDDQHDTLFDNRGSEHDNTISVMALDKAVERAADTLRSINSGEIAVEQRSLSAPSNGVPAHSSGSGLSSGSGDFLWKPISESDGRLVVLLPSSLTGQVVSAGIYSSLPPSEDTLLEAGRSTGDSKNGNRAHFRFSKPGRSYPDGVYVVAQLRDGSTVHFQIGESSARNNA